MGEYVHRITIGIGDTKKKGIKCFTWIVGD